jgi:HlyD family secretion protein
VPPPPPDLAQALAVRRGDLRPLLLLTGELKATQADTLTAPRTPSFQLVIKWMLEDGTPVAAGQPVVQFDDSTYVSQLEEKRLAEVNAALELKRMESDAGAARADKAFAVEQKRTGVEKARILAAVPSELLPRRDYQQRQLDLAHAETDLAKAQADLKENRGSEASDLGVQRIVLDKARRDVATAEETIRSLTLHAQRAGMFVIAQHPWEGRKVEVGDTVWSGILVATLPELTSLTVEAALSDVDDGKVAPGMEATCYLDAYPQTPYPGRVVDVAAVAKESGRTALLRYFPVRVALAPIPPRAAARLRPGMSVRVEIAGTPVRDALLVPRAALDLTVTPPRARLAEGGSAPLRLGPCDAFWCVAESGVKAGQLLARPAPPAAADRGAG